MNLKPNLHEIFFHTHIYIKHTKKYKGFDSYTTPSQQLHNNPSHEGGLHTIVVLML
jgi:hypothetical protein